MKINQGRVVFERADLHFLESFGPVKAIETILLHQNDVPFAYDTWQLAALLGTNNRSLWKILRDVDSRYRDYSILKKNGKTRRISAPDPALKSLQRAINRKILMPLPISKYARAYFQGAKISENAAPHVGKKVLLKLDLTDFFGSIRFDRVLSEVFHRKRYPKQIGTILTSLCCRGDVLPQGAPTSPAISNLVLRHFDDVFGAWCERRGFSYTRYCDDLTVSGNASLYPAYQKAKRMLEEAGFRINRSKTRFLTNANRQTVTGLTVNEKLAVPSDYKRKLRQEVYYVLKFGFENVLQDRFPKDVINAGGDPHLCVPQLHAVRLPLEIERYRSVLLGKIDFVLSIEPENRFFREAKNRLVFRNCEDETE